MGFWESLKVVDEKSKSAQHQIMMCCVKHWLILFILRREHFIAFFFNILIPRWSREKCRHGVCWNRSGPQCRSAPRRLRVCFWLDAHGSQQKRLSETTQTLINSPEPHSCLIPFETVNIQLDVNHGYQENSHVYRLLLVIARRLHDGAVSPFTRVRMSTAVLRSLRSLDREGNFRHECCAITDKG